MVTRKIIGTKLDVRKMRFLSRVAEALRQTALSYNMEEAAMEDVIVSDLVRLENNASAESVILVEDSVPNGKEDVLVHKLKSVYGKKVASEVANN